MPYLIKSGLWSQERNVKLGELDLDYLIKSISGTGIVLTTNGNSGPSTLVGNILNIPQYAGISGIVPISQGGTNTSTADFQTLTFGATTTWNQGSIKQPFAKVTGTGSFTLSLQNVISGASGILKLITNTASAITVTFDTNFTNKTLNTTFTTYVFPALIGQEYYMYFTVDGATIEWTIISATGIADPGGSNDDFLQRKAGVWTNRSISQVLSDINLTKVIPYYMASTVATLTNQSNSLQIFPLGALINYPRFSFLGYKSIRLCLGAITVGSASANSPRMYIQYTTTFTGTPPVTGWTTIGAGTVASGEAISLASVVYGPVSNWIAIPAGALLGDVMLRVCSDGGDGVADPAIINAYLELSTQ